MKIYIIDYTRPDGRHDFTCEHCDTTEEAASRFHSRGIDGWTGFNYADYKIDKIAER